MTNNIRFLSAVLLCLGLNLQAPAWAQKSHKAVYIQAQIDNFIREVYQDQADALFFNPKSGRMALVTDFLSRLELISNGNSIQKKLPLLSSLELIDKYNPNLKRDAVFDPKTFNPLKYNFSMGAKSRLLIRVDDSDFVIAVNPVQ